MSVENLGNGGHRSVTKGMKTADSYWCPARGGATAVAAPGTVVVHLLVAVRTRNKHQSHRKVGK
ncbi:hypothetical protein L798_07928 [Zootermopsis nevadensis]|uniref:Uncharacterized protein n=1 Tax=Zootermopsis nevadensis TaxID=136037 RepID=A0A067RVT9_ZOONE|nr:hypothetical protein L798_07928 [Zootermopsis nevadensis]